MDGSGGNIYTVNGDGSNLTRLTYGLDPSWSSDGTQIAFARWDNPAGLYVMNADGTYIKPIFAWQQLLSPEWSPDGSMIAFSRQYGGNLDTITKTILTCRTIQPRPGQPAPATPEVRCSGRPQTYAANPLWTIGVVNVSDSALVEPKSILNGHAFSPSWNTDNSTLAYADAGYGVVQTDTKADQPSTLFGTMPVVQSVSWSPDGTQIAFEVRQQDHWEVAVMNSDGSNEHSVTMPNPLAWGPVNNVSPRWSPDGKQILFMSDRNGRWEFFVINPDGTGIQQVLKNVTDTTTITYNFNNERVIDWTK
jgi:TolB protein